jgi:PleD family two-component response regulator
MLAKAVSLFNQLRESFAALEFLSGKEVVTVHFSCGVATLSTA